MLKNSILPLALVLVLLPCAVFASETKLTVNGSKKLGKAVSISSDGKYALLGSADHKAAYMFEKDDAGTWQQRATLTSDDATGSFAIYVSISKNGKYALVGDAGYDRGNSTYGAAYVFTKPSEGWGGAVATPARLTDHTPSGSDDAFGTAVSISDNGEYALVGAPGYDNYTGATYVFVMSGE